MNENASGLVTRFDFLSGPLRGTHLGLYPTCLMHRGEAALETLPLAAIASVRVGFERDARRMSWGAFLIVVGLILYAVAAPIAQLASSAGADLASAGTHGGVVRALLVLFRAIELMGSLLPAVALGLALAGIALGVLGWLGTTRLALTFGATERIYPSRGRDTRLIDFAEAVSERLILAKR